MKRREIVSESFCPVMMSLEMQEHVPFSSHSFAYPLSVSTFPYLNAPLISPSRIQIRKIIFLMQPKVNNGNKSTQIHAGIHNRTGTYRTLQTVVHNLNKIFNGK